MASDFDTAILALARQARLAKSYVVSLDDNEILGETRRELLELLVSVIRALQQYQGEMRSYVEEELKTRPVRKG
ncbi:MAG: hypothetical protein U1F76_04915 [Candidatus Competibacteraceae bacterium]